MHRLFISIMENQNNVAYPFDYQEQRSEETEELKKYFSPLFTKTVRLGSKGYFFFKEFDSTVLDIYNMEVRPSDTFVLSFPRSGTTWTQELVWLLQNQCDFERAKTIPLTLRFPFLEIAGFLKLELPDHLLKLDYHAKFLTQNIVRDKKSLSKLLSPRFMKSHSPMSLLPPSALDTAKVVYVARDPLDVVVSNFYQLRSIQLIPKDKEFKSFWNFFVQNKVLWCPYFEHVKEAWNQRNHPNMTFIFYEELSEDLPAVARRLATFFGKQYTDEQFEALCDHLKFENFKNNISINLKDMRDAGVISEDFIRKGKVGGWREHFDDEMTQQAEQWMADNLRDTDLRFPQCE